MADADRIVAAAQGLTKSDSPTSSFKITGTTSLPIDPEIQISSQTEGGVSILQYPQDLLRDRAPVVGNSVDAVVPFMGFYILVPSKSEAIKDNEAFDDSTTDSLVKLRGLQYAQEVNKPLEIKAGNQVIADLNDGKSRIRVFRKVNLIKQMICLYMPDTINQDLVAEYNTFSIGHELAQIGSVVDFVKSGLKADTNKMKSDIMNFLATMEGGGLVGGLSTAARFLQAGQGTAVNPLTEVFFENMQFRQFNFDFKFQPRNADEAKEVRDIIQTFRMYMVPEISQENVAGIFFTVPAFFQIKYYVQAGGQIKENDKIPKISGCALTGVQTDWAPDGLSLHPDMMPNAVRMQLNFTELEIMHRDKIKDGY